MYPLYTRPSVTHSHFRSRSSYVFSVGPSRASALLGFPSPQLTVCCCLLSTQPFPHSQLSGCGTRGVLVLSPIGFPMPVSAMSTRGLVAGRFDFEAARLSALARCEGSDASDAFVPVARSARSSMSSSFPAHPSFLVTVGTRTAYFAPVVTFRFVAHSSGLGSVSVSSTHVCPCVTGPRSVTPSCARAQALCSSHLQ